MEPMSMSMIFSGTFHHGGGALALTVFYVPCNSVFILTVIPHPGKKFHFDTHSLVTHKTYYISLKKVFGGNFGKFFTYELRFNPHKVRLNQKSENLISQNSSFPMFGSIWPHVG